MSWSKHSQHTSKLCCVVNCIGKLYDKDICKQCLKDIVKRDGLVDSSFEDVLAILNAFQLNDKN